MYVGYIYLYNKGMKHLVSFPCLPMLRYTLSITNLGVFFSDVSFFSFRIEGMRSVNIYIAVLLPKGHRCTENET